MDALVVARLGLGQGLLDDADVAAVVAALSDSLGPESVTLSPEWATEIGGRIAQIESGEVKPVPWNEVEARIKRSLGRG